MYSIEYKEITIDTRGGGNKGAFKSFIVNSVVDADETKESITKPGGT